MTIVYVVLFFAGSALVMSLLGGRVNRLVYGTGEKSRTRSNLIATLLAVVVSVAWLCGWGLAIVFVPARHGRWVWITFSVLAVSILNGLRSDYADDHEKVERLLKNGFDQGRR